MCVRVYVCKWFVGQDWKGSKVLLKTNMHTQLFSQMLCTVLKNIENTWKYKHFAAVYERNHRGENFKCTHVYTCACVHNMEKLKHTHPPNLLLHTIPTLNSLRKQALQRQHTHSHTKNSRGPLR